MSEYFHEPVLLAEVMTALNLQEGAVVLDATLGGGGHAGAILQIIGSRGQLYAFDQDEAAIKNARIKFKDCPNLKLINANFKNLKAQLAGVKLDAALFDLGVSSYQLDQLERGFSWKENCLLDMRMDTKSELTALTVINNYSQEKLATIIKNYGEENFARKISREIVTIRKKEKLTTSKQLKDIVFKSVKGDYAKKITSVARVFQAIRIEVNDELNILETALLDAIMLLEGGGRIAVIAFHSLEDRIVKDLFRKLAKGCTCPPQFPRCICGNKPVLRLINKKPLLAGEEELKNNVRARSAKLRGAEKI